MIKILRIFFWFEKNADPMIRYLFVLDPSRKPDVVIGYSIQALVLVEYVARSLETVVLAFFFSVRVMKLGHSRLESSLKIIHKNVY